MSSLSKKPLWEEVHDGLLDDIRFDLYQLKELRYLQKKNSYNKMGDKFYDMAQKVEFHRKKLCKEYMKRYGSTPQIRRLKKDIENGWSPPKK